MHRWWRATIAAVAIVTATAVIVVGPRAEEARASATATNTFDLVSLNNESAGRTPPDTFVAKGPNHLVEVVNSVVSVWNPSTGALLSTPLISLDTMVNAPSGYGTGDPRVAYDEASGRFFLSAHASNSAHDSQVRIAVSDTADPLGTWTAFVVVSNTSEVLYDQPRLGITADKVVLSWEDYQFPAGSFSGTEIVVVEKADLLAAAASPRLVRQATAGDSARFGVVPADDHSQASDAYLVWNTSTQLALIKVTGKPSTSDVSFGESFLTIRATAAPPFVPQRGTTVKIDAGDDRFLMAEKRGAALWTSASVECPGSPTRACSRLIQVDTATPAITQDFDAGIAGANLFYPSVTINGLGDAVFGFSASSPSMYVSMAVGGQLTSDVGRLVSTTISRAGLSAHTGGCFANNAPARWGDYSGASPDPADSKVAWVASEYSRSSPCNWGTAATRMTFPAPTFTNDPMGIVPAGGTLTVNGNDFSAQPQTIVRVDGSVVAATVLTSTQLQVPVPPQGSGGPSQRQLTVQTPYGTSTSATIVYRNPPSISGLSPSQGPATGGTSVTITGSDLNGTTTVMFGGIAGSGVNVVNSTTVQVTAPAQTAGAVSVVLTADGMTSAPAGFTYVDQSTTTTQPATTTTTTAPPLVPAPPPVGYRLVATDGGLFTFGDAPFLGSTGDTRLNSPIVAMAATPSGGGYWLVAADGGIFNFGSAPFLGSMGGVRLNAPIVAMAATPSGGGYWLVGRDGSVFSFGDAQPHGSASSLRLNSPVVGIAPTPLGNGYWLVAQDGGIFSFGDASFFGSTGNLRLNAPIVGMTSSPTGNGYWFVATDGGIFSYGDATFFGSTGNIRLNKPIVGMSATPTGQGYWLVATDGGIFSFGDAGFLGSTGDIALNKPIVGMSRR